MDFLGFYRKKMRLTHYFNLKWNFGQSYEFNSGKSKRQRVLTMHANKYFESD